MSQVELLEQQIAELDGASFSKLRDWFLEFDQARWDKKLAADSNAGKLDFFINAALAEQGSTLFIVPTLCVTDIKLRHKIIKIIML